MTTHKFSELRDKISPERKARNYAAVAAEISKMNKKSKKNAWKKPPRKLYLVVVKDSTRCYSISLDDVHIKRKTAMLDIKEASEFSDCDSRLYEYVLVEKPIIETKPK